MTVKEKAETLYKLAIDLHGQSNAKEQAIKSAIATRALAPIIYRDFWQKVIEQLNKKP